MNLILILGLYLAAGILVGLLIEGILKASEKKIFINNGVKTFFIVFWPLYLLSAIVGFLIGFVRGLTRDSEE